MALQRHCPVITHLAPVLAWRDVVAATWVLCQLQGGSNAHFGFRDLDDGYRFGRRGRPRSDIWPDLRPLGMRAHRVATACKGAYGAIRAIANFPATPNAWTPRAELTPIAGSIPGTRSRASGAATIDHYIERQRSNVAASHRWPSHVLRLFGAILKS